MPVLSQCLAHRTDSMRLFTSFHFFFAEEVCQVSIYFTLLAGMKDAIYLVTGVGMNLDGEHDGGILQSQSG